MRKRWRKVFRIACGKKRRRTRLVTKRWIFNIRKPKLQLITMQLKCIKR
ncbi:MAG: hypothetical protein ACOX3J_14285 [Clostridia bacterium]